MCKINIWEVEEMAKEKETKEIVDEYEELTLEDRVMNIEKKVNWTFGLTVVITIISVLLLIFVLADGTDKSESGSSESSSGEPTEVAQDYDVSEFKEIKAQDIKKESKGKNILIYVGRSTCGYCVQYVPVLKEVQSKHKYKTYYIDIAKILNFESSTGGILDDEANNIMQNLDKEFMKENWGATPLTLVVKDSKIVDSIVGYVPAESLETLVKNNGFAK